MKKTLFALLVFASGILVAQETPAPASAFWNGSFEILTTPNANYATSSWDFASGKLPNWWFFNKSKSNGGKLEILTDNAPEGKVFIRVSTTAPSTYPTFGHALPTPIAEKYTVNFKVRGKAVFQIQGIEKKIVARDTENWTEFSEEFVPGKKRDLVFRLLSAAIELDDVKIIPVEK